MRWSWTPTTASETRCWTALWRVPGGECCPWPARDSAETTVGSASTTRRPRRWRRGPGAPCLPSRRPGCSPSVGGCLVPVHAARAVLARGVPADTAAFWVAMVAAGFRRLAVLRPEHPYLLAALPADPAPPRTWEEVLTSLAVANGLDAALEGHRGGAPLADRTWANCPSSSTTTCTVTRGTTAGSWPRSGSVDSPGWTGPGSTPGSPVTSRCSTPSRRSSTRTRWSARAGCVSAGW